MSDKKSDDDTAFEIPENLSLEDDDGKKPIILGEDITEENAASNNDTQPDMPSEENPIKDEPKTEDFDLGSPITDESSIASMPILPEGEDEIQDIESTKKVKKKKAKKVKGESYYKNSLMLVFVIISFFTAVAAVLLALPKKDPNQRVFSLDQEKTIIENKEEIIALQEQIVALKKDISSLSKPQKTKPIKRKSSYKRNYYRGRSSRTYKTPIKSRKTYSKPSRTYKTKQKKYRPIKRKTKKSKASRYKRKAPR